MFFRAFLIMMVFFVIIGFIRWYLSEFRGTRKQKEPNQTHEEALIHIAMREHELGLMPHVDPEVLARCEECRADRIRAAIVVDKFQEYHKKEMNEAKLMKDALQAFEKYGTMTPNEARARGYTKAQTQINKDFS